MTSTKKAVDYSTDRPHKWIHNEKKHTKTFMLTDIDSKELSRWADELGLSRSEVLERAIRNGGMAKAKSFKLSDS